jgi:hypothetical protein
MQVILANGSFERAVEALGWSPTILSHSFKRRVSGYWVASLVLLWWGTAFAADKIVHLIFGMGNKTFRC